MNYFYILIVLLSLLTKNVSAITDVSSDDSCNVITSPYSVFTDAVSLGLFATYSYFFTMVGVDCCSTTCMTDCDSGTTADAVCDATQTVSFNFTSSTDGKTYTTTTYSLSDQTYLYFQYPPAIMRGFLDGSYLCIQFLTSYGFQSIGCKTAQNEAFAASTSPCYAGQSCESGGTLYSRTMIPLTASVIQCITETLDTLFDSTEFGCADSEYNISSFSMFTIYMSTIIRAVLILYITLFGMKIALSADIPNKSEAWIFFTKIILVLYFAVGLPIGTDSHGVVVMQNGITTLIQPFATKATFAFSNLMYNSVNDPGGLCYFSQDDYTSGYAYLAIWDSLDCRIFSYINGQMLVQDGLIMLISMPFFTMLFPLIIGFQLMFLIMSIFFTCFLFSILIFFAQTVVTALISISILCYFGPVFIPFCLFKATKGYFDSWVKLMFSYILQPMVITTFIAMVITVYDTAVFGDCTFSKSTVESTRPAVQFTMDPSSDTDCTESWGYMFGSYGSSLTTNLEALFINIPLINPSVVPNLFNSLLTITIFSYIFYIFSASVATFAGELTGGVNIGKFSIDPMAAFNFALKMAKASFMKGMSKAGKAIEKMFQ